MLEVFPGIFKPWSNALKQSNTPFNISFRFNSSSTLVLNHAHLFEMFWNSLLNQTMIADNSFRPWVFIKQFCIFEKFSSTAIPIFELKIAIIKAVKQLTRCFINKSLTVRIWKHSISLSHFFMQQRIKTPVNDQKLASKLIFSFEHNFMIQTQTFVRLGLTDGQVNKLDHC